MVIDYYTVYRVIPSRGNDVEELRSFRGYLAFDRAREWAERYSREWNESTTVWRNTLEITRHGKRCVDCCADLIGFGPDSEVT